MFVCEVSSITCIQYRWTILWQNIINSFSWMTRYFWFKPNFVIFFFWGSLGCTLYRPYPAKRNIAIHAKSLQSSLSAYAFLKDFYFSRVSEFIRLLHYVTRSFLSSLWFCFFYMKLCSYVSLFVIHFIVVYGYSLAYGECVLAKVQTHKAHILTFDFFSYYVGMSTDDSDTAYIAATLGTLDIGYRT